MGRIAFTFLAAGLGMLVASTAAHARDYPYCLQSPEIGIPGDCSYETYAQCRASASGRYADCNINPRVAFGRLQFRDERVPRRRWRHPRH